MADGVDRVFLLGEHERILLVGAAYARVCGLVDGRRPVARILAELAGELHPAVAHDALATLETRGYLIAVRAPARVAVIGLHDHDAGAAIMRDALTLAGVELDRTAAVHLVVVPDYLAPQVADVMHGLRAAGAIACPVKLDGERAWLGPTFGADGPCWSCLAHRLQANRPVERYLARRGVVLGALPGEPGTRRAAAAWAALMIRRDLPARLRIRDPYGQATEHAILRRPQCPACGDPALYTRRAAAPVVLSSQPVIDGGRTRSAAETFAACAPLVDPLTGVVSSLGPIAGTDSLVWAASLFVEPTGAVAAFDDFHATSMGKGETPAQARIAALAEALERVSAGFHGDEPVQVASRHELGDDAIHPDAVQLFSAAQLADRDAWNRRNVDPRRHVPRAFDADARIAWVPAWSVTHQRRRWLPAAYCYLGAPDGEFCQAGSNGHATGNCLEEAILQGLLELVERDAVAIWWYGRELRPPVELPASFVERLAARGWQAWAMDLTHDLGIPVRVALACDANQRWCIGLGAHLDAEVALARAMGELRQLLVVGDERWLWTSDAIADAAFLYPAADRLPVTAASTPVRELRDAIERVVAALGDRDLEVLVVDQTRPDLVLSAAQVIVPGMRHVFPRFAPGRLYDVAVRLGWRSRPLGEAELNPVPLFL